MCIRDSNMIRHDNLKWLNIQTKLIANLSKLWSVNEMEISGGEPDVVKYIITSGEYIFCDCSKESPKGRRSPVSYTHLTLPTSDLV